MMPLAGATLGAASGALGGKLADLGITNDFMRQAARTLQSGNAALFLLIRKMTTVKVLAALRGAGGHSAAQPVRRDQGRGFAGGACRSSDVVCKNCRLSFWPAPGT